MRETTRSRAVKTDKPRSKPTDESAPQANKNAPAEEVTDCPECDSTLQQDGSETVCSDCGLVVDEEKIDHGPEWRAYNADQKSKRSRVGPPSTVMQHDNGLSTQIDFRNKDAHGNSISSEQRSKMHRLRKWQERTRMNNEDRQVKKGLTEISRMGSALGAPESVRETAAVIYRRAHGEGLIRGRSIEGMTSGALYHAFRTEGASRSLDEITAVARVDRKEIGRAYRYLASELGLETTIQRPKEFVPRFTTELDTSHLVERQTMAVLSAIKGTPVTSGTDPTGIAAASIYVSGKITDKKYTQKEIGEVADVTEVTIRNRYQDILNHIDREEVKVDPDDIADDPN